MEHLPKGRNGAIAKRMMKRKAKRPTLLNMLPEDAIVEIVSQLVSSSSQPFADLYSLKCSCKAFFVASKDKMVKQQIALERDITGLTWMATDDKCMAILKSCGDAGNAEANFMLALINIFKKDDIDRGAEFLEKASSNEHKAALYVSDSKSIILWPMGIRTPLKSIKGYSMTMISSNGAERKF